MLISLTDIYFVKKHVAEWKTFIPSLILWLIPLEKHPRIMQIIYHTKTHYMFDCTIWDDNLSWHNKPIISFFFLKNFCIYIHIYNIYYVLSWKIHFERFLWYNYMEYFVYGNELNLRAIISHISWHPCWVCLHTVYRGTSYTYCVKIWYKVAEPPRGNICQVMNLNRMQSLMYRKEKKCKNKLFFLFNSICNFHKLKREGAIWVYICKSKYVSRFN